MLPDRRRTLEQIANDYHELNGDGYEVLESPPTALEFLRLVRVSRPVVISGMDIPASRLWSDEYLASKMGDRHISVAVTPDGRADAITRGEDGRLYFVEPAVRSMTMNTLLSALRADPLPGNDDQKETYYLQSQNGNMYPSTSFEDDHKCDDFSELEPLQGDVPREIPWCSEALGKSPDAVNIWIGNGKSVTSIHSDPYENVYTVIRGEKHFTLVPPTEGWYLQERMYPHATYTTGSDDLLRLMPSPPDTPKIRWSSVENPHLPGMLHPSVHPIHITLQVGQALYLPAGWWHHVRQSGSTIALNWWYDLEYRGMQWIWLSFLRGSEDVPDGNEVDTM